MLMAVYPITESFGAEIGDIDLSKTLSSEDWAEIDAAFNRYSVLVFPEQHLSAPLGLERRAALPQWLGQLGHQRCRPGRHWFPSSRLGDPAPSPDKSQSACRFPEPTGGIGAHRGSCG
jgi:alpha-ketoglutarate-dependent taurine dioxygenase